MEQGQRTRRDYTALSPAQRIEALARMQRLQARLDAERVRLLAAIELHPSETGDAHDKHWDREEVAATLRLASGTARARMQDAVELVHRYPATLAALETARITYWHALRLVEAGTGRSAEVMAEVEARVLARAGEQSVGQFKAAITRALARLDPQCAEDEHADATAQRRVVFIARPNGTSDLWAPGIPTAEAAAMAARISDLAKTWKGTDERSADQRQADALITLVLGTTTATSDPGRPAVRQAVHVVVAASTLLGIDEQPGELAGHGPIPAGYARALAFDPTGTWRRLLTDPDGRLVDVSAASYTPPANMARLVRLQHPTCRFPSCNRPARNTELDHITRWTDGGPTTPTNLQPLCSRHHHLKDETGWQVTRNPDLTTAWTSPTGHTYPRPPDDHLPRDGTGDADEQAA